MMRMEEDWLCSTPVLSAFARFSRLLFTAAHVSGLLRVALQIRSPSNWVSLFSSCGGGERVSVCVCIERELVLFIVWVQYYQAYTDTAQKLRPVWRLWEGTWVMYLLFISSCHLWRVRDEWWGLSVLDEGCEGLASNPQWVWGGRLVFFPSQSDTIGWMYPHL